MSDMNLRPINPQVRIGHVHLKAVAFAIRPASLGYWIERLVRHGVKHEGPSGRFGEQVLSLRDLDGLQGAVEGGIEPEAHIEVRDPTI